MASFSFAHGIVAVVIAAILIGIVWIVGHVTKWHLLRMVLVGAVLGLAFQIIRIRFVEFADLSNEEIGKVVGSVLGAMLFTMLIMVAGIGVRHLALRLKGRQTA